tara:strand:+ start:39888 stop:42533 length:2646 start_codon:yes stop_codon:yes gene_type:complete
VLFSQSFDWLKTGFRPDCSNGVYPRDVSASSNGSVTSTGYFYAPSTTVDFDGQTLTQNGTGFSSDVYVANYDQSGTIQWLEKIGTDQSDGTYPRVDTDDNDNIYVAADLAGTTGGSTGSAAGIALTNVYPNDAVVVKLNSSGTAQWAQHMTDANGEIDIRDIEVTSTGDFYITGSFSGSISVDGTTQTADGDNFFVAKFDTDGNLEWWRNSTGVNSDIGYRVEAKGSNVYVLGQMAQGNANTSMTVNGNTNTLPNGEARAHFLVKYSDAGVFSWFEYGYLENTGFGSGIFPYYCDVVVDDNDDIYTIHTATPESQASAIYQYPGTSVTYNTVANTSGGGESNYIITKYNSAGTAQWARGDGTSTTGTILPTQMILHSDSKLIVTNIMSGTTEIDDVSFTSAGSDDMIIAQFDLDANLICSQQYGGTNQDWAMALDENPDGSVAYAGHVFGSTTEAVITSYDGIDMTGCRNTGVTGVFSPVSVSAEFSFATYPTAEVCQPNSNGLIISGSPSGYSKTFISSPAGLSIDGSTGEIDVNASTPGTYSISHILSDGTPCGTDTVTKTFTINEGPTSNAGADFSVCGTSATLDANTPNTGSGVWSITSGPAGASFVNASNPTTDINGLSEGSYTLQWEVTNTCGSISDEVIITVNEIPQLLTNGDQEVCSGEEVTLNATTSAGTISWNNGVTNNTPFVPTSTGTYTVTADNNGCTSTEDVLVTVNDLPTVTLGNDETTCVDYDPIQLNGNPTGGTYSGPGVTGNEFDPQTAGVGSHTITYTYQDGNGCENSATQTITVEGCASLDQENSSIAVYPNPADEKIFVQVTNGIEEVQIISALGQKIDHLNIEYINSNEVKVNVSHLARGSYFVKVKSKNETMIKKLIIK